MKSAFGALIVAAVVIQQANPPPPQPTFRTEANYVRVDVYPTKDEAPVGDLRAEEFEVFEDGKPQSIEQFEHVVIRGHVPEAARIEPNTVRESRAMLENSRARVFVIFLDPGHVDVGSSHNIRRPLIEALDRMIGPDDLVGFMTPEMSARDVTFARKTTTIEGFLTKYWYWGERDRLNPVDPVEQQYEFCYGPQNKSPITAEMIARRREKRALDAIQDLVRFLRGVREERKAILAVTDGWLLYRPNRSLMAPLPGQPPPTGPPITLDPRTGKPTTKDTGTSVSAMNAKCERDRLMLAQIDDEREFLQILDEANRANASFYPLDPRGLAVFDTPISAGVPLLADQAMLRSRSESLRTLAGATDGTAIITNDISGALRRVVDDLSSYYLLGYYSTGRLDGKFHSISVRVKRPGIRVRARRGYLAASTADATLAAAARSNASVAPSAEAAAEALAIETALAPLPGYTRDTPLRTDAVAGWRRGADGKPAAAFWVVAEFSAGTTPGRTLDATVVAPSGATAARATSDSGARSVLLPLTPADAMEPGEYTVRVRGEGFGVATIRVKLPPSPDPGGALFFRRGQTTGNQTVVTADRRFRRSEQLRMEMPVSGSGTPTARLLDRTGKALAVPVNMSARDDSDGTHWQTAQLGLAPLAPSDYIIEIANGQNRTMIGFRVVP
jgi:VWFA-related protein